MKIITQDFKKQIKELGREIESRIIYGDNETITSEELFSISPTVNGNILKSAMKELDFESSIQLPINTLIKYEFGLKVNGEYEWVNYGNYIVYSSEFNEDTKTYEHICYDSMLFTMKEYKKLQNGKFPMTIREYLNNLNKVKPVILCGDLNVAHKEIDLKNPKTNRKNAGFTDEERNKMTLLLKENFIDTFRYLYPEKENAYTWWSYMGRAREKNIGWRIDYFITSNCLAKRIVDNKIYMDVMGSDHCPIELDIEL